MEYLTELDRLANDLKKRINERANQDNDSIFKIDKLEKIKNESLEDDILSKSESLNAISATFMVVREHGQPYKKTISATRMDTREHGQPYKNENKIINLINFEK